MGKLLLVGCGKMGGAMLDGWLARGLAASDVIVAEPVEALRPRKAGLRSVGSSQDVGETPEMVVLAVKPQTMDAVLPDLRRFADNAVFLSIAAGKTLTYFASHLGATAKVVRSMPNTPAAVRQGITVACASSGVSATEKKRCQELLVVPGLKHLDHLRGGYRRYQPGQAGPWTRVSVPGSGLAAGRCTRPGCPGRC